MSLWKRKEIQEVLRRKSINRGDFLLIDLEKYKDKVENIKQQIEEIRVSL